MSLLILHAFKLLSSSVEQLKSNIISEKPITNNNIVYCFVDSDQDQLVTTCIMIEVTNLMTDNTKTTNTDHMRKLLINHLSHIKGVTTSM